MTPSTSFSNTSQTTAGATVVSYRGFRVRSTCWKGLQYLQREHKKFQRSFLCRVAACLRAGPSAGLSWAGTQNDENDMVEHATFKNDSLPFEAAVPSSFSRNASARASKHSSWYPTEICTARVQGFKGSDSTESQIEPKTADTTLDLEAPYALQLLGSHHGTRLPIGLAWPARVHLSDSREYRTFSRVRSSASRSWQPISLPKNNECTSLD